jgi:hypothetical protein
MFRPPYQPPHTFQQPPIQQGNFLRMMPQRGGLPQQVPVNQTGIQGLLQRFLPGKAATSGAGLSASSGGSNLMGTLNNVQQVLKVAQQATPLIKEYGPMIKNAPKLINMMKALNEINKEDDSEEVDNNTEALNQSNSGDGELVDTEWDDDIAIEQKSAVSRPKLFI